MSECELASTCIFFNGQMAKMPSTSELYKEEYCRGDQFSCARYLVFEAQGSGDVPGDLFPNDLKRARTILGQD